MSSHAAAARELYKENKEVVDCVLKDLDSAGISLKLKALLRIATKARESGKAVTQADIDEARKHGADERDIHDTVLIAATFSMFNRYVDVLGTLTPEDPGSYDEMGKRLATIGYVTPKQAH